eukprot:Skav200794  [mRNA]  locus=scaffold370:64731:67615:+ [translate_table: standard]
MFTNVGGLPYPQMVFLQTAILPISFQIFQFALKKDSTSVFISMSSFCPSLRPSNFGRFNDLNLTLTDAQKADGWHFAMSKEQEWDKFGYVVRDQIRFRLHVQDGLVDVDLIDINLPDKDGGSAEWTRKGSCCAAKSWSRHWLGGQICSGLAEWAKLDKDQKVTAVEYAKGWWHTESCESCEFGAMFALSKRRVIAGAWTCAGTAACLKLLSNHRRYQDMPCVQLALVHMEEGGTFGSPLKLGMWPRQGHVDSNAGLMRARFNVTGPDGMAQVLVGAKRDRLETDTDLDDESSDGYYWLRPWELKKAFRKTKTLRCGELKHWLFWQRAKTHKSFLAIHLHYPSMKPLV